MLIGWREKPASLNGSSLPQYITSSSLVDLQFLADMINYLTSLRRAQELHRAASFRIGLSRISIISDIVFRGQVKLCARTGTN